MEFTGYGEIVAGMPAFPIRPRNERPFRKSGEFCLAPANIGK